MCFLNTDFILLGLERARRAKQDNSKYTGTKLYFQLKYLNTTFYNIFNKHLKKYNLNRNNTVAAWLTFKGTGN